MRLPKTVTICGKPWKIVRNKKAFEGYGRGNMGVQEITVGSKYKSASRGFETYFHEVAEMVAIERGFRYDKGDSDGSIFIMTHKEFECFASDIAAAIMPMVK